MATSGMRLSTMVREGYEVTVRSLSRAGYTCVAKEASGFTGLQPKRIMGRGATPAEAINQCYANKVDWRRQRGLM